MKKEIEALTRAYQEVKEGRFVIPEEVPANERTAFHGAAAAAHKDGKSHFNFGGKKYPVTMKKDTARAIADDVKEDVENEMMHNDKIVLKSKKKKKGEDDPDGENGETAVMNPKNENVKSADKKPEKYIGADGKTHVRMVPVDREVIKTKKESTDMSIREKLLSVLESDRAAHYKGATKPEEYDEKSKSSKGAMDMLNTPKEVGADIKKATDDNAKAEKKAKVSPKNSTDKDAKGDMKIVNPVVDITQKAGMKESFTHEVDHTGNDMEATRFAMKARDAGIKAQVRYPGKGKHTVVHLGHHDEKHIHNFLKKHYDSNHDMEDTKAARMTSTKESYQPMHEEYTHEVDHDGDHHDQDAFVKQAQKSGIKAKVHTRSGPGGGAAVIHLGHSDEGKIHDFLKKNYSSDHTMGDTKASRITQAKESFSFSKTVKSIASAYQSMYAPKEDLEQVDNVNEDSHDDMAAKHEMHWADHTKKAKEARDAGDRDHAVAHMMAADAHDHAGRSHEKQSKFAKQNTKKAMAASQKANNFYKD